ncbi:MAG: class B sortase [bacterium]|nr:class B sortase [bacterium]
MRNNKKIGLVCCIFLSLLVFFLFNKNIIDTIRVDNVNTINEVAKVDEILKNDDNNYNEKDLEEKNDIVGSIKISGTNINNKIVQTNNNIYYLNHNINKEEDYNGSIFLDYRNKKGDRKYLIYGHNSKTLKNALFHDLEKYVDASFYEKNQYIDLVLNNEKSVWQIFSVMIIDKNINKHMKITFNDEEWIEHISWMKNLSIYNTEVDVNVSDKILTLQTCYYKPNDSFLIINAKKI